MAEKCNVPPEDRARLLHLFEDGLTPEEEAEAVKRFDQYLFYHRLTNRKRLYLCTSCGNCWPEERSGSGWVTVHNSPGYCPKCRERITYKAVGRLGQTYQSLHEEHNAIFLRACVDGALLITGGRIVANYEPGALSGWPMADDERIFPVPTFDYWERRRYYIKPGQIQCWKRNDGEYKGAWGLRYSYRSNWEAVGTAGEPNPSDSVMTRQPDNGAYMVFGWDALAETEVRYSAVDQYFDPTCQMFRGVTTYLGHYAKRPQMEYLVKLGHHQIIDAMLDYGRTSSDIINWRVRTPAGMFRLTKAQYKAFQDSKAAPKVLPLWRKVSDEITLQEFLALGGSCLQESTLTQLAERAAEHHIKLTKLLRYCGGPRWAITWLDYIRMSEQLNLDLTHPEVLLPKNLQERHDNAVSQVEYQSNIEAIKQYRKGRYKKLCRRYELEAAGYRVIVPQHGGEIRAEGAALRHCVGGYAKRHMEGKTTILFLRRADAADKPLCTIEMMEDGTTIRQIHGYHNDIGAVSPKITYRAFLDIWLPWLKHGSPRDQQGRPVLPRNQKLNKEAV